MLDVDEEVAHGFGPLRPPVLLFDLGGVDAEVHDLALLFEDLEGQFQFLCVLDVLHLLDQLSQGRQFSQQVLQHNPKHFLTFLPGVGNGVEGPCSFGLDLRKVAFDLDVQEAGVRDSVLEREVVKGEQEVAECRVSLLPVHIHLPGPFAQHQPADLGVTVLDFDLEELLHDAGFGEFFQGLLLAIPVAPGHERLLFQLDGPFLKLVQVLPKLLFSLLYLEHLLLQLPLLALQVPQRPVQFFLFRLQLLHFFLGLLRVWVLLKFEQQLLIVFGHRGLVFLMVDVLLFRDLDLLTLLAQLLAQAHIAECVTRIIDFYHDNLAEIVDFVMPDPAPIADSRKCLVMLVWLFVQGNLLDCRRVPAPYLGIRGRDWGFLFLRRIHERENNNLIKITFESIARPLRLKKGYLDTSKTQDKSRYVFQPSSPIQFHKCLLMLKLAIIFLIIRDLLKMSSKGNKKAKVEQFGKKLTQAEISEKSEAAINQKSEQRMSNKQKKYFYEENPNKKLEGYEVSNTVEGALNLLDQKEERHPQKRFKAAFEAYCEQREEQIRGEDPKINRAKRQEMMKKEFDKHPDNPLNKKNVINYNDKKEKGGKNH